MAFGLYSLLEAILLVVNAMAVLNEERFLSKIGFGTNQMAGFGDEGPGVKNQMLNLIRSVRTLLTDIMKTKIFILQQGYAYKDEEGYKVSATSTLIIGKLNIIVDPGGSWETNEIVNQLKENGLSPSNIDVVVGTHGHSDHIGNINLFPKAKQIVGFDINVGNIYFDHNLKGGEKYILVENDVEIIPTPGHTHSDVSVVVYNAEKYGVVGICGDLFDSKLDDGVWQGLSESIEVQKKNRNMMTELCDFLIPGHGSIFKCK